jgi:NADPH:quinone reductase
MVKAIRVHAYGGVEALSVDDVELGPPGPGEVRIRHTAVGVNFADIHNRTGRYPLPALPHVIGGEAAGVIEETGPGVTGFAAGDRVAYSAGGPDLAPGAYAQARNFPADRLILLPHEIDDAIAAAMTTKGLTAHYLIHDVYSVEAGETILVHAAAGGVGLVLCQWAAHLGARVIGVVGSEEKAGIAAAHGCRHVLVSGRDDVARRVRELTAGEGVPVVFDSVGRDTFEASLAALRPHGLLVSFGSSSGPIPPFDVFTLNRMGSLYLTSAAFYWYMRSRAEMLARAAALLDVVLSGAVRIRVNQTHPLAEAARAHGDLEARRTTGMTVLLP